MYALNAQIKFTQFNLFIDFNIFQLLFLAFFNVYVYFVFNNYVTYHKDKRVIITI